MRRRESWMWMVLLPVFAIGMITLSVRAATAATITAKAQEGGKIYPSGAVTVRDGATQQFAIAPATGWTVLSVTGCSGTLGKASTGFIYTTGRVTGSCTVIASFKRVAPQLTSFKINNDAAETQTQAVTLSFTTGYGSVPTACRASSRSDFAGVAWRSLGVGASSLPFELDSGAGTKTLYFQLADSTNVSNVMSDSINLLGRQLYTVSGREFYAAAQMAGFTSRVDGLQAGCHCVIIEGPADRVQADQVAVRAVEGSGCGLDTSRDACQVTFFEGKTLQNGFVFKSLFGNDQTAAGGCELSRHGGPYEGTNSIRFTVVIRTIPNLECQYVLYSIVLEGPANRSWREALGLKP